MAVQFRQWHSRDKSSWPQGPWQSEPDKVQWTDPTTGFDCLIVRGPFGGLCGYVGVKPGHPWHGVPYTHSVNDKPDEDGGVATWGDDCPTMMVHVHGGITYSDFCDPRPGHEGDAICHVTDSEDKTWWFGFDCAHSSDYCPGFPTSYGRIQDRAGTYRDLEFVRAQVFRLAVQLLEFAAPQLPARAKGE